MLRLLGAALLCAGLSAPALAQTAHHESTDMEAVGKALANPVSDVWALFTEFDFSWADGDLNKGGQRVSYSTIFQPVMPLQLTESSKLITRPTVPLIWSQQVPGLDDSGGIAFDRKTGLGDIQLPVLYSPNKPIDFGGGEIAWGLGPSFVFPTATDSAFQSDQFQAGPAGILVWKSEKITAGVFPQWWWSYADVDSDAKNTSKGNLTYFWFYNLPNAWQIGTNPVITYDHKASGGNGWNVPVGITVAKTTRIAGKPVKFQLGAEYSVAHEDDFGKRWLIKLNIIPVIAPLIKKPLF